MEKRLVSQSIKIVITIKEADFMRRFIFCLCLAVVLGFSNLAYAIRIDNSNVLICDTDRNIITWPQRVVNHSWMNWQQANAWVSGLANGTGWQLRTSNNQTGYYDQGSGMDHLYYVELSNNGRFDVHGNPQGLWILILLAGYFVCRPFLRPSTQLLRRLPR